MRWSHFAVLALVQIATATPLTRRWDDLQVKHAWADIPRGWVLHGEAPADHKLKLRVGLKQDKFDELVKHLYEVSDPSHERYGAHLSQEEVNALVAPHPESVNLVESWCEHHGVDMSSIDRSEAGDWFSMTVTVEQAERMLGTKYNVYHHPDTDSYTVRTTEYSVPSVLHGHISVVAPTTYFGNMRSFKSTAFLQPNVPTISSEEANAQNHAPPGTVPASCNTTITPACLRALYKTINYVPRATSKNKIGVDGYLEEYANDADLQLFLTMFRPDAAGTTFPTVEVHGGLNNQSDPGFEANLDIQYTESLTFPTPNIYYSTGGSPPFIPDTNTPTDTNEPYLDWLDYILLQKSIPQTFSTSYGDDEQTVPKDYAISVCNMFAQLGARGSSVLFASGDFGVGGADCLSNDGKNITRFQPAFPASCPFVTTVGATTFIEPEVAASFSGGGFSNYFPRPSYQEAAVNGFLKGLGKTYTGLFNPNGRGYPDVSAQGENFDIYFGGDLYGIGGTSASTPTVSSVISLLNDFRISSGKPPLGFLNPLIYSSGVAGLNDIKSGSNPGCGTNGFTARQGWDPVTGLGSPDFVKLQGIVANA